MLPRSLCDNLCSLTPDDDKLTFSVVFYLCADGTLCKSRPPWFGRSVIRTAACLNYDVTQKALDAFRLFGSSDEDAEQLLAVIGSLRPPSLSAKTWHEVWGDLIVLESLTQQVRTRRFEVNILCYALANIPRWRFGVLCKTVSCKEGIYCSRVDTL